MEQATVPEPYLAVLDAFSRLLKKRHRAEVEAALKRCAPTWVAQLPVLAPAAGDALARDTLGATPGRMLREVAEALEDLTRNRTFVLLVDDAHWSDEATIDFVSLIARRSEPARLMLVLTYRPLELASGAPALKIVRQELLGKGLAQDVPLDFLAIEDVNVYLNARFAGHAFPDGFAAFVRAHTGGNPLFITHLLDHLQAQAVIDRRDGRWALTRTLDDISGVVPESLRQLIEAIVERLPGINNARWKRQASAEPISPPRRSRRRSRAIRRGRAASTSWRDAATSSAASGPTGCRMAPGRPATRSRMRSFSTSSTSACPWSAACVCT